jgi:hypothetical protein
MSRICLSLCVILIGSLCVLPVAVMAQHHNHTPFADPCLFDYDLQWFKPLYCDDPDVRPPNTGFFFAYSRLYWNVQRPDFGGTHFDGDFTWGNRLDFGYMLEDDRGWLFNTIHIDGPQLDDAVPAQRTNVADLSGFEINRLFRLQPFHSGTVLEPFFGVKYLVFEDRTDQVNTNAVAIQNNIFGGQVGGRYYGRHGRWLLSSELRFLFANNYQFLTNGEDAQEFVPQGELRLQAAFDLTEKAAVRVGWDLVYFGQGMARAPGVAVGDNDEDLLMSGLSFGVTLNR